MIKMAKKGNDRADHRKELKMRSVTSVEQIGYDRR